jgi:hypothetical protein
MNACEQAEAFRLMLLMGVASRGEIVAWADSRIERDESPPEWLLDLSLAANQHDDVVESKLRDLPCEGDRTAAAYSAVDRVAEAFRSGSVPPQAAARMLQRWANSARANQHDAEQAMAPSWYADEVEYGYTSEQDVIDALNTAFAHFATMRRSG